MSTNSSKSVLTYHLTLSDNRTLEYHFNQSEEGIRLVEADNLVPENWMALEHHQCSNCTLNKKEQPLCPIATNLSVLLKDWHDSISYDEVELNVVSKLRTTSATTTAQKALSSLLGLIMATSDCPRTQFFRPMAQFHLPLASSEETSFRAISTHLITQFFRKLDGQKNIEFDLQGLLDIYNNMHTVNVFLKKRLESAVEKDAALNAVVILDLFAITLPTYLDDELEKLKPLFSILVSNIET